MSQRDIPQAQADLVSLHEGEEVLGTVSFHWLNWLGQIVIGLVALPLFGLGLPVLFLVHRAWKKSGCIVTDKRIIHMMADIGSVETIEIRWDDIRSISTYEAFGGGGVKLDTGAGEIAIKVTNPREMASVLREEMNRHSAA
ncbi:PH domain-containing protein [Haloferax namakaokahaiae]|uniref:PH domain-containing protein n=1 Tax=Haloferax namakaokahaiae TaxID=1748331 RepID=A0ABD5ZAV9_9EURY